MRRVPLLSVLLLALTACGPPRLPSVQFFVESRVHTAVAVPAGEPLRRAHTRDLTAGVRLGFAFERRGLP
jgi:hypothetical protein